MTSNPISTTVVVAVVPILALFWAGATIGEPRADPPAPRRPVTDTYHGHQVADDYRWLENGADPEVRAWSNAQNAAARAFLDSIPCRAPIVRRLEEVTRPIAPEYYALDCRGGVYFALKEQPPKQQPMLIRFASPGDLSDQTVLVDPNELDPTGNTSIDFFRPSLDGRLVAVSLSQGGSESGTVFVFETESGRRLPDVVPGVNGGTAGGSVAWSPDGRSFLRTRYPQEGERPAEDLAFYEQVHLHTLGKPAGTDAYVFGRELPRIAEIFLSTTDDGRWVLADVLNGDGGEHGFWLRGPGATSFRQITRFEDGYVAARLGRDALFLLERKKAPNGRIVRLPLDAPGLARAELIVAESDAVLEDLTVTDGLLYLTEGSGGPSHVRVFDQAGRSRGRIPLPEMIAVNSVLRTGGDEVLVRWESYTIPPHWSRFAPSTGTLEPTALDKRSPADFQNVEVRRETAISRDGTRVPLTVLLSKGARLDGTAAALLSGYGGFGISLSPSFDEKRILWLEQGGVLAIANLRGGGEFGERWHEAGRLTKKQNVFDDFAACAHRLVEAGYTRPERLAIEGGSNGGLLMGAALTQHPQLFRAVVARVGIFDMLRNEQTPNGRFNTTEYGSTADPEQFAALRAYSPYHRVQDGTPYPSALFLTGEHDPRVDPYHSRKMTARLQAASSSDHPILLRTSAGTGHGVGTPYAEKTQENADVLAFLFDRLGLDDRTEPGAR